MFRTDTAFKLLQSLMLCVLKVAVSFWIDQQEWFAFFPSLMIDSNWIEEDIEECLSCVG